MRGEGSGPPLLRCTVVLVCAWLLIGFVSARSTSTRGTLASLARKLSSARTDMHKGIALLGYQTNNNANEAPPTAPSRDMRFAGAEASVSASSTVAVGAPSQEQPTGIELGKLASNGVIFNAIYGAPPTDPGKPTLILPNAEIGHPSNFFPTTKEQYMESLATLTPPMGVEDGKKRDVQHRYTPMFARPGSPSGVGPFTLVEKDSSSRLQDGFINSSTQRGQARAGGYEGNAGPQVVGASPNYQVTELPIVNMGIATVSREQNFLRQSLQGHPDPVPRPVAETAAKEAIDASQALMARQPLPASITNRMDNGPQNGPPAPPAFG